MYSQQFTVCYFLVKSPLLRIRSYNFLRHRSVNCAPPPKKNPGSAPAVYIVTPFCPSGTRHFEHALISGYKVVDSKLTNWTVCTQGPGSHFCARKQSRTGRVRILQGYLKKGYDHVISECPAAFTVLGTRCLRNCPGNFPHLVPENQCLGTADTKWCCVHPLSTWYVTAYIITRFLSLRRDFESVLNKSTYKVVD